MNIGFSSLATRFKVGVFTVLGLVAVGAITVYVNDKPFWWRPCQLVRISVEDATGLKEKSPIRSLGIDIGYLESVELSESRVTLGICITAPVEVLPATKAHIRGEGFLGDKFVELKPVRYLGPKNESLIPDPIGSPAGKKSSLNMRNKSGRGFEIFTSAWADEQPARAPAAARAIAANPPAPKGGKEIQVVEGGQDVQQLVKRVDTLVNEITGLTTNIKDAINPEELRQTMRQLNKTLENASKTLAPEGGLNQTAQRTLAKLEDSIEQLRDQLTRINRGQGSLGMILNDPSYAEEIKQALVNMNKLLTKVGDVRFVVDVGGETFRGYDGSRGWGRLQIWPKPNRYYLLGISKDPRGVVTESTRTRTETVNGVTLPPDTRTDRLVEKKGLLFTAMLGRIWEKRFEAALGVLHDDAVVTLALNLGPPGDEQRLRFSNDVYSSGSSIDDRIAVQYRVYSGVYVRAGLDSVHTVGSKYPLFVGAGVSFDDEDIKLLFALR
ncbi:MlaD family protein [Bdellovibrionota bacterium FG-1]